MFSPFLVFIKKIPVILGKKNQGGFGLIELLVSLSIMALVASIIMTRQDAFNSAVLLRNQAYAIALQVREVQLSAVAASNESSGTSFRSTLGVYFNSSGANDLLYRIFRDADGDHFYDSSERYGIQGRLDPHYEIREIRVGSSVKTDVAIVFERPNFDAQFYTTTGLDTSANVEIDVSLRDNSGTLCGEVRTVEITRTGQISVQPCP